MNAKRTMPEPITRHSEIPPRQKFLKRPPKLEGIKEECTRLLSEGELLKRSNVGLRGQVSCCNDDLRVIRQRLQMKLQQNIPILI